MAKGEEPETLEGMDLSHDTPAPARKKSKKRLEKEKELKKKEEPFLPLSESLQGVWESMKYDDVKILRIRKKSESLTYFLPDVEITMDSRKVFHSSS